MPRAVDVAMIDQVEACLESAVRALLIGLRDHAAGHPRLALTWYDRAAGSLRFGSALAESLRSRRGLEHG